MSFYYPEPCVFTCIATWTHWWQLCHSHSCLGFTGRKSAVPWFFTRCGNRSRTLYSRSLTLGSYADLKERETEKGVSPDDFSYLHCEVIRVLYLLSSHFWFGMFDIFRSHSVGITARRAPSPLHWPLDKLLIYCRSDMGGFWSCLSRFLHSPQESFAFHFRPYFTWQSSCWDQRTESRAVARFVSCSFVTQL